MARFIQAQFPTEHAGIARVTNGLAALRSFSATRAALAGLAVIGKPITARVGAAFAGWQAARKQRNEDYKLWNLALQDARIMADLSRAMSRDAARDVRGYY